MALIRRAWPDILAAINSGHNLKRIHSRLNEIGIPVKYKTASAYLAILRREHAKRPAPTPAPKPRSVALPDPGLEEMRPERVHVGLPALQCAYIRAR
jgi:hypothetical protein